MPNNSTNRCRSRKRKSSQIVSLLDKETKRLANLKTKAEIDKIKAETDLVNKQFRLAVFRMIIASGGVFATLATVLKAIFGN